MSLLTVERIKLASTRSPYWCLGAILFAALVFALLFGLINQGENAAPFFVLQGVGLGQSVFMILAALAVTTEYRFNTIKETFLAAPRRLTVLLAKTSLLAGLGALTGFVAAMAAFFLAKALATNPPSPLVLQGEVWRQTAGYAALFAIAAVIAVAVGVLVRQSAGAVSIVLVWTLVLEGLISIIPTAGPKIAKWLPFRAGNEFIQPRSTDVIGSNGPPTSIELGPVGGLLVFLAWAVVLWVIAAVVLQRRDA